ncbi:uncharacterized protein LOC124385749 isoform X1 [Silurus meridionalis]|uniref:uncharacterized protein LOC124385749 isoform X1 n=1 Tax=Silurus meridionalis TaxID=175797 RepID=UPI001EEAF654|nr:uncharacterized protein LOC124385749 isoform X1 [Silurus meridionalis]
MNRFWILILIFCAMYAVKPGGLWVSAQSLTEPPVYQPDKELSVDIGDSATLRCCVSENTVGMMALFKQPHRAQPQIILKVFRNAGRTFSIEFQNGSFQTRTDLNCFNVTISNITQSDEAMYYCALISPDLVFADGTFLKIKVLSLGTALGLCALFCLVFCVTYFTLKRMCDKVETSVEDCLRSKQLSRPTSSTYGSPQLFKKKTQPGGSDYWVHTDVMYAEL